MSNVNTLRMSSEVLQLKPLCVCVFLGFTPLQHQPGWRSPAFPTRCAPGSFRGKGGHACACGTVRAQCELQARV